VREPGQKGEDHLRDAGEESEHKKGRCGAGRCENNANGNRGNGHSRFVRCLMGIGYLELWRWKLHILGEQCSNKPVRGEEQSEKTEIKALRDPRGGPAVEGIAKALMSDLSTASRGTVAGFRQKRGYNEKTKHCWGKGNLEAAQRLNSVQGDRRGVAKAKRPWDERKRQGKLFFPWEKRSVQHSFWS